MFSVELDSVVVIERGQVAVLVSNIGKEPVQFKEIAKKIAEAEKTDESPGTLAPWYTAPGGAGSVKVIVSNLDFDKATSIVTEFEKNIKR